MWSVLALALVIPLAACGGLDHCEDCNVGPPTPAVAIYDDGTTLAILGCDSQPFTGCVGTSLAMTAIVGGQTVTVPAVASMDSVIGAVGVQFDHRVNLASPSDPEVEVTYGQVSSQGLVDLPAFAITGPTATVSRASGPVSVHFDVLQDTTAAVVMTTFCEGGSALQSPLVPSPEGDLTIDLREFSGMCSHRVDVAQTRTFLSAPPSDLSEQATRLGAVTFLSQP